MSLLIAFNGTTAMGQFLGDTICSIKVAWLFAQNYPCSKYYLALSPHGEFNFLWQKFIDTFHVQVIYDSWDAGNMDARFEGWDKWRRERQIDGVKFEWYKELYRRIDGAHRQRIICGHEAGLGRKNIFEYMYFGQEDARSPCNGSDHFGSELIYWPQHAAVYDVLIAPRAKCQGNDVFTFDYWSGVVHRLVENGIQVTVNHDQPFCNDLKNNPLYRQIFPPFQGLLDEVTKHRLVACGNTGVGWLAAAAAVPLLAMQPVDSNMQDYRYEWCGVRSLIEFLEVPDVDYCVRRIMEQIEERLVLTTGCFDILHGGHIRHLQESRMLGTKLVVALNSDASVKRLKGEGRPYQPLKDREAVLRALRCVDDVKVFDGDDALDVIHSLRPAVLTNGCDHKAEEVVGADFVKASGGQVVITTGDRESSTTKTLQRVVRQADILKTIRDAQHLSVNPFPKLKLLAEQFGTVLNLPGEVADLGAYRGATGLILNRLAPDKRLHLFDTWRGTPHYDPLCHHKPGEWAADINEVKRLLEEGPTILYHEGVFPETAQSLNGTQFCFAYVDMDVYQSVKAALDWLWPRMVPGGKILIDDADWEPCRGTDKAINETFTPDQLHIIPECHTCIVTKPV